MKMGIARGAAVLLAVPILALHSANAGTVADLEQRIAALEAEADQIKGPMIATERGFDISLYGQVRMDAYHDSDYNIDIGFGNIGSSSPENGNYNAHIYHTRLGLRGTLDADGTPLKFNVEGDFFGGTGGSFRVRHAYGEYGGFLVGQTWSNWAPQHPISMLDANGVPTGVGERVIQARYTFAPMEGLTASVALEDDIRAWKGRPNLTGALRYDTALATYKVTGISRGIEDLNGDQAGAWGASLSASFKPWDGGALTVLYVTGEGIGSTINYGAALGQQFGQTAQRSTYDLDASGKPVGVEVLSFDLSHQFSSKFQIGTAYGLTRYDDIAGAPRTSVSEISAAHVTARYRPTANMMLALEYGKFWREERSGGTLSTDRILGVAQISF